LNQKELFLSLIVLGDLRKPWIR